jgi:hypothetical protein
MTYSDFLNWQQEPVTQAFYEAMQLRIEDCKDILSSSAGIDQINDNFNRGFIAAYTEALDFRVEDVE